MKPKKLAETITAKSGEMVLVPAGHFLFGKEKTDAQTAAYYIDKTEVTNQAYAKFAKATGHPLPPDFPSDKPNYPVVNVTIDDAEAFAKWAGERLPSAREWEKAARGTDGRDFPWGNEADPSKANIQSGCSRSGHGYRGGRQPVQDGADGRQRLGTDRRDDARRAIDTVKDFSRRCSRRPDVERYLA